MHRLIVGPLLATALAAKAVPETPDVRVNDIAITTMLNGQVVIAINPIVCQQLGQLVCDFFRAHEYGHAQLGHVVRPRHPQQAEFEADCWAAQNAHLQEVCAAHTHFFSNGFMGSRARGTGFDRARRLAAFSQGRPR